MMPRARSLVRWVKRRRFDSSAYWQRRYAVGGSSGSGSIGRLATYKAEFLNGLVAREHITSVIEFGCGDGKQLQLAEYPIYIGLDVSPTALEMSTELFRDDARKSFFLYDPRTFHDPLRVLRAELALSLDVIYHLIEDEIYERYMHHLFAAAERFVVIYSSDFEGTEVGVHIRHRNFSRWIEQTQPAWHLISKEANPYPQNAGAPDTTFADFHIYGRKEMDV